MKKILLFLGLGFILIASRPVNAGLAQGGDISFDLNPKSITATSTTVNVDLKVTIYEPQFRTYCGAAYNNQFVYIIYEQLTGPDDQIKYGTQAIDNTQTQKEYVLNIPPLMLPIRTTSPTRNFIAELRCENGFVLDTLISTSRTVTLVQGGALGTAYACAVGGIYKCSPGGRSDCSDQSACTGGVSCIAIATTQCEQPTTGGTGIGTTTTGSTNTGVTGTLQSINFVVPNWLRGEPTSLIDLLNIIAKWIFNLSIPVAVALIIWAGFVFMTAGADPSKVKKGKDILKWVVVGLAIIFINKGFISLIRSILELGNPAP